MHPIVRTMAAAGLAGSLAATAYADEGGIVLSQTTGPAIGSSQTFEAVAEQGTQTMVWAHRGTVAWGIGIEHLTPSSIGLGRSPRRNEALLVGVSLATGSSTRLTWQSVATDVGAQAATERPVKVSFVFERRDALRDLRRGSLLRMELSGQTNLALRARGGRVGLALTSRW